MENYYSWIYDCVKDGRDLEFYEKYRGIPIYKSTHPSLPDISPVEYEHDGNPFLFSPPLLSSEISIGPGFKHKISIMDVLAKKEDDWVSSIFNIFINNLRKISKDIKEGSGILSNKMTFDPFQPIPFNFIYDIRRPLFSGLYYTSPVDIEFNLFPFKLQMISKHG